MPPLRIVALSLLLSPLGQAEEPPVHLGPITGIVTHGDHIYSVSQAGIFREAKRLAKPPFRVMSMAGAPRKNAGSAAAARRRPTGGQRRGRGAIDPANAPPWPGCEPRRRLGLLRRRVARRQNRRRRAGGRPGADLRLSRPCNGQRHRANRHQAIVRAVAFSPTANGSPPPGLDGLVLLTPRKPKAKPIVLADHSAGVESLAFAPDSSQLATGSRDSRVRLHTIEGRLLRTFQGVGEPPDATGFGQAPRVLVPRLERSGSHRRDIDRLRVSAAKRPGRLAAAAPRKGEPRVRAWPSARPNRRWKNRPTAQAAQAVISSRV